VTVPAPARHRVFSRRRFLGASIAAGAYTTWATITSPFIRMATAGTQPSRWSNPATWGGRVPGAGDVATVSRPVLLDVNARVAGVVIRPGASLTFHARRNITLTSTGNVVVRGRLRMAPAVARVVHRIRFVGIDERRFVGGGMRVLRRDVGLWVMGGGSLRLLGSSKLAWTRTSDGVPAGSTSINLRDDPVGWRVGDRLAIAPTQSPAVSQFWDAYDYPRVSAISGRTITLSAATTHDHPAVTVRPGVTYQPEVLNLTRNVRIEGTPSRRSHVFVHNTVPRIHRLANVAFRHLGPRRGNGFVLGRYGLHFHHCHGNTRGSTVIGCVMEDIGSHAYVPHESNGITFRNCVSHNTMEDAYWWDIKEASNSIVWDRCVASRITGDPDTRSNIVLAGFTLGVGRDHSNVIRDCVAFGIQGDVNASGYKWPELTDVAPGTEGIWVFEDNLAHNNRYDGLFVWQVTPKFHPIMRFTAYHCGGAGVDHGAYINPYRYEDLTVYGCAGASIIHHAASRPSRDGAANRLTYVNAYCDGAGLQDHALVFVHPSLPEENAGLFSGCRFRGFNVAAVHVAYSVPDDPFLRRVAFRLENCIYEGNEFWLDSSCHPDDYLDVVGQVDGVPRSIRLRRSDQVGVPRPGWNAVEVPIT
jgi:hypothetical protein